MTTPGVTTLEELLPLVEHATTAREFGAAVIAAGVKRGHKIRLALAARDALGRPWTDKVVQERLAPGFHTDARAEANRGASQETSQRWRSENRQAAVAAQRRWYHENRGAALDASRRWKAENPEAHREAKGRWYRENGEAHRAYQAAYSRGRRAKDPGYALRKATTSRINHALRAAVGSPGKVGPTLELLGCSAEEFRLQIESLWEPGMSWDNWGDWHVDHVVPVAAHDLSTEEGQRAAFHFTNCQPLWAEDNLSKGSLHDGVRHRFAG